MCERAVHCGAHYSHTVCQIVLSVLKVQSYRLSTLGNRSLGYMCWLDHLVGASAGGPLLISGPPPFNLSRASQKENMTLLPSPLTGPFRVYNKLS